MKNKRVKGKSVQFCNSGSMRWKYQRIPFRNMGIHGSVNRENDDAYYMVRSYNNCYYSSSEFVSDEEDEL